MDRLEMTVKVLDDIYQEISSRSVPISTVLRDMALEGSVRYAVVYVSIDGLHPKAINSFTELAERFIDDASYDPYITMTFTNFSKIGSVESYIREGSTRYVVTDGEGLDTSPGMLIPSAKVEELRDAIYPIMLEYIEQIGSTRPDETKSLAEDAMMHALDSGVHKNHDNADAQQ